MLIDILSVTFVCKRFSHYNHPFLF